MKKLKRRYETVPVAEVWKKAIVIDGNKPAAKAAKKDEPDSVAVKKAAGHGTTGRWRRQAECVSKRVLVVDDEHCIADTLAAILRYAGYETIVAYDGESALQHCEFVTPDLVITDVVMPGINGVELAIRIRQRHPECKILLFSGVAGSADLLEGARRQGYDFELVGKPIHPADLLAKVSARAWKKPAGNLGRQRKTG